MHIFLNKEMLLILKMLFQSIKTDEIAVSTILISTSSTGNFETNLNHIILSIKASVYITKS